MDVASPGRSESKVEELEPEAVGNDEEEVEYKCTDCEFSSLCWDSMKRHSDSHLRKESFKCHLCSFSARLESDVSLHLNRFHCKPTTAPPDVICFVETAFGLSNSNLIFSLTFQLLKVKKESDAAPERSVESTRSNKKQPKTGNVQKFVYECSDCEYSTHLWANMKRHKEQHNKSEEFKCDGCSFSARSKGSVRAHSNRYHRKPPSVPLEVSCKLNNNSALTFNVLTVFFFK